MQKTISLLLVKAKPASASAKVDRLTVAGENDESSEAWSDAAKAMSRKLRPTDSVYRLSTDLFALVLPETDVLNAKASPSACRKNYKTSAPSTVWRLTLLRTIIPST